MSKIRRYDEIMEYAMSNMIAKQNKITDFNEGSVIHTFLDTVSRLAERLYIAIRQGYNEVLQILPYSPFKFEKKSGMYATGSVKFLRSAVLNVDTIIPVGTEIQGSGVLYVTTETGTIPAGELESVQIGIRAAELGAEGNADSGAVTTLVSALSSDVTGVINNNPITGGSDAETDTDFENRFRIYLNGLSGTTAYSIKNAALSADGVKNASVVNHNPPLGNVYNATVYIDDGSGGASPEVLKRVRDMVEGDGTAENPGHLAPGINIRVLTPVAIKADFRLTVKIYNKDSMDAQNEISEIISEYVQGLTIGEDAVLNTLIMQIMNLNYVRDVVFTAPTGNIEAAESEVIRTGGIAVITENVNA